jgi:sulfofructose kinase
MKQVICAGLAVLDHVFQLPKIPKIPVKSFACNYLQVGGGNAATAAVALKRAGGKAIFWGRLGDDHNGDLILDELDELGVDVRDVFRQQGVKSGVSSVLVDDAGERLITNYTDPKLFSNADWLPLERLKESNAVLVDFRWQEGAIKTLRKARELGIPAVLDADLTPEGLNEDVIRSATHVLFSQPALKEFAAGKSTEKALSYALELNRGWVGVTEGSSGTRWLDKGSLRHFPAFEVNTVDTLGAGDVFHGIFALGLAEGKTEASSISMASAAAAIHCSRSGGRKSIPDREEINNFIRNNK